jgi:hypothetical protein
MTLGTWTRFAAWSLLLLVINSECFARDSSKTLIGSSEIAAMRRFDACVSSSRTPNSSQQHILCGVYAETKEELNVLLTCPRAMNFIPSQVDERSRAEKLLLFICPNDQLVGVRLQRAKGQFRVSGIGELLS